MIPILVDDDRNITTEKFDMVLKQEFEKADYKVGLFGVGTDGHTAGILPESGAINSENLAYSYDTPTFSRITMTPKAIEQLDEAVVWAQGEDKWKVIKDLNDEELKFLQEVTERSSILIVNVGENIFREGIVDLNLNEKDSAAKNAKKVISLLAAEKIVQTD